ncbi:YihY/virulence factor BrkB family protein [Caulobacter sp. KR2-114]|uniref:YihY/virulence factor BrkB family protein n=1 Tax=Caulobacter sp. KR2-114 TaxID=3400912 RepID=UPI003C00651F
MSLSSRSDPADEGRKPSMREAAKMAPWLAILAMAALWPRRRKPGEPVEERPLTPEDFAAAEPGRGRDAEAPWEIPALGWKDIFWRTYREMGRDRLGALAGGITFFVLLATFPAVAAFVSLYGLFSDVSSVERQLEHMSTVFPRDAVTLIGRQMLRLATQRQATLSAAFVVSTLVSVWSANAGMKALFDGLNIAYDELEKRDYLRRTLVTYGATFSALAFLVAVAVILVGAPVLFEQIGIQRYGFWWRPMRWVVVYLIAAAGFTLLYRYGPSRVHAAWRWVAGGGAAAALLWMAGSLGFSWYVNNFTHFGVTYGSLGAVVAFMLWVWFSVMVLLTGAEFNSEIEHQTACDTTAKRAPRPMGERGAAVADNLGKAFTVSPREAMDWSMAFAGRQVGYVTSFLRRAVGHRT